MELRARFEQSEVSRCQAEADARALRERVGQLEAALAAVTAPALEPEAGAVPSPAKVRGEGVHREREGQQQATLKPAEPHTARETEQVRPPRSPTTGSLLRSILRTPRLRDLWGDACRWRSLRASRT